MKDIAHAALATSPRRTRRSRRRARRRSRPLRDGARRTSIWRHAFIDKAPTIYHND